jgi:hypothetical protein
VSSCSQSFRILPLFGFIVFLTFWLKADRDFSPAEPSGLPPRLFSPGPERTLTWRCFLVTKKDQGGSAYGN